MNEWDEGVHASTQHLPHRHDFEGKQLMRVGAFYVLKLNVDFSLTARLKRFTGIFCEETVCREKYGMLFRGTGHTAAFAKDMTGRSFLIYIETYYTARRTNKIRNRASIFNAGYTNVYNNIFYESTGYL